jgi:hypothetical protein
MDGPKASTTIIAEANTWSRFNSSQRQVEADPRRARRGRALLAAAGAAPCRGVHQRQGQRERAAVVRRVGDEAARRSGDAVGGSRAAEHLQAHACHLLFSPPR